MNKDTRIMLRLLVCGYLVYLGWDICKTQMSGGSAMSDLTAYCAGGALALAGAAFAAYTLMQYRKGRKSAANDRITEDDEAS
ncbi:MAG: hypothetical protein ACI4O4_09875 [Candidatus Ventricola sp.]